MYLIGIAGKARSGKDSLANQLVQNHSFAKYAFASKLLKILLAADPILDDKGTRLSEAYTELGYEGCKETYPELPRLMQQLGTEGIRKHLGENTWIDAVFKDIDTCGQNAVIADVRFPNEAQAIRNKGGIIVVMVRRFTDTTRDGSHESEALVETIRPDVMIYNESDLGDLRQHAADINRYMRSTLVK